jgi:hypothetical protein
MKNPIGQAKDLLIEKSNELIEGRLSYSKEKTLVISSSIGDFILRHSEVVGKLAAATGLSLDEVEDLIRESATVVTFSALAGWELTRKGGALIGLKGAAVGASVGLTVVIGRFSIKMLLTKLENDEYELLPEN